MKFDESERSRNKTRFARWLLQQVKARKTTLTALGRKAGLSLSTLRSIIVTPGRRPSLDTCLRLSLALDLPVRQVLEIAGLDVTSDTDALDPNRSELVQIYDSLPASARLTLLAVARSQLSLLSGAASQC